MKRIVSFLLTLALLLGTFAVPAHAEEQTALPGFGFLVGAEADYIKERNNLHYYRYNFSCTPNELLEIIGEYKLVAEAEDLFWLEHDTDADETMVYCASLCRDSDTSAKFGVFFKDLVTQAETFEESVCTWNLLVGIPEEMVLVEYEPRQTVELPGLGHLGDTNGTLVETDENGVSYYVYLTDCTLDDLADLINEYDVMLQEEDFIWQQFEPLTEDDMVYYAGIAKDDCQAEIFVLYNGCVKQAANTDYCINSWMIFLAVPEEMVLTEPMK